MYRGIRSTLPSGRAWAWGIFCVWLAAAPAGAQLQLPGATIQAPPPTTQPRPPASSQPAPSGQPRPAQTQQPNQQQQATVPVQRRPEDVLPGRTLRFLGQQGSLVITRVGPQNRQTFTVAMTGVGRRGNDVRAICTPDLTGGQTTQLTAAGRPNGLPRYVAAFPGCRVTLDLMTDSIIVSAPDGACRFTDDCTVDPSGLWGPVDRDIPPDREIERSRGQWERLLNDARRTLTRRLGTSTEGRQFLSEQAAFPAVREQQCRNYGTTDAGPGYCALKLTEARAVKLRARLARPNADADDDDE